MTPYYQDRAVTLYHGDCREILPQLRCPNTTYCLEACDGRCEIERALVLTDPPYGIAYDTSHTKYHNGVSRPAIVGDSEPFGPAHLLDYRRLFIWGGNCFSSRLPDSTAWAVWVKTVRQDAEIRQSDCEMAWTNCLGRSRVFTHLWIGAYRDSESGERSQHPTQKPLALMTWCIGIVEDAPIILDPYAGSGTTLRAAKDLGRRAIGIEIEERYCEIAAKRLAQEVLTL